MLDDVKDGEGQTVQFDLGHNPPLVDLVEQHVANDYRLVEYAVQELKEQGGE
jgi:hypothetical protein